MVLYAVKKPSVLNRQRAFSIKIVSQANFTYTNGVPAWAIKFWHHSHSTTTNQFCLEIIICRVCRSFDYLIYPYYPAYIG